MSSFDPVREREVLPSLLDFERSAEREAYLPNSVGHAATAGLVTAVTAWIVGFEADARALVEKYQGWLEDSVDRKESFGDPPSYFAAVRCDALALAQWLTTNTSPVALHGEGALLHEQAWADLPRDHASSQTMLERYLPDHVRDCLEAGGYDRAAAVYERFGGRRPFDVEDVRDELEFGYWASVRQRAGNAPDATYVLAGEGMLRRRLGTWLTEGEALRAAAWLKVVYWNSGVTSTPGQTLAKTYDVMPGVSRPERADDTIGDEGHR